MTDRRLVLGLGAAALFGVGFGLGWLVRGEQAAPVDLASPVWVDGGSADGSASLGEASVGDGGANASEGGTGSGAGVAADGSDRPRGEGSVAVVGASGEGAAAAGGSGGDERTSGGGDAPSGPIDGGVRGRLDRGAIQDVVREHRGELGFCFAWQLHQHPDLNGRLTMEFEIGPDGTVTEARVAEDALGDETVLRCFLGVTRRMEFPPPEGGGTVTVRYPFQLAPGDDEP